MSPEVEAYEMCQWAAAWSRRLAEGAARLEERPDLEAERAWLEAAYHRVEQALTPFPGLEDRAITLSALAPVRAERSRRRRAAALEALEALQADLLALRGPSAPLLELLFENLKLPRLKRIPPEEFVVFAEDMARRLTSSYVRRQLEDEAYASAAPQARKVEEALTAFRALEEAPTPTPEEATILGAELVQVGAALETPVKQARLLVEAASLTAADVLEDLDLLAAPRRKGRRSKGH